MLFTVGMFTVGMFTVGMCCSQSVCLQSVCAVYSRHGYSFTLPVFAVIEVRSPLSLL